MRLSWKLAVPQVVIVMVLGLISFIVINSSFVQMRKWYVKNILENRYMCLLECIEDSTEKSVDEASLFAAMPAVQKAYELALSGNIDDPYSPQVQEARELLRRELAPVQEGRVSLTGKKIKLHFHLPNERSFVRLWRDKNSVINGTDIDVSDNLHSIRTMVMDVNENGNVAKGIESGPSGFVVRGVVPIIAPDGRQLGSMESLQDFEPVVEFVAEKGSLSIIIYSNDELLDYAVDYQNRDDLVRKGNFIQIAEIDGPSIDALISPELLEKGRSGTVYERKGYITLAAFPLIDYRGEQAGVTVMALNTEEISVLARNASLILSLMLAGMLIIPFVLFISRLRRLATNPLNKMNSMIQDISANNADLTAHLPDEQHDEIGELARSFNTLLVKLSGNMQEREEILSRLEKNLRRSEIMEHWYRTVLDTIPFSISTQDEEMRYTFINKEFEQTIAKTSRQELIGQLCSNVNSIICNTENCSIACAKRGQNKTYFEHNGLTYQVNVAPLKGLWGEITGFIEVIQDITQLEELRIAAEAQNRAKSLFLANMSHEIRTPLNAVIGMTTIGKNTEDPERMNYCFSRIENASTHLLGVINDILDMSKIEANKFELSPIAFQFEKVIQQAVNVVSFRAEEKHHHFAMHIDEHIPETLVGDDQRLVQVITNLLGNAVKFTPENGSITLVAKLLGEDKGLCSIQIEVRDTGIGISTEEQAKLFQSFQQAESGTTRSFGGTGLGLAISKNIVGMMGGKIWVESEAGKGSSFIFTVQMERGSEEASNALEQNTEDAHESANIAGCFAGRRILLAEDVDINREIVLSLLEPTEVVIDCAVNGAEAVRLWNESPEKYDMIFMDVQMPEMDGYEATRQIRSMEKDLIASGNMHQPIPIIAMTANVFREDVEKSLA
ncbi:MAG: response regulator, partial [Treponema sp.]|nr:response regulator [Treponema sp.]